MKRGKVGEGSEHVAARAVERRAQGRHCVKAVPSAPVPAITIASGAGLRPAPEAMTRKPVEPQYRRQGSRPRNPVVDFRSGTLCRQRRVS